VRSASASTIDKVDVRPASPDRARVVPKTRAVANKDNECGEPSATERQRALTWAQRLERVFAIDIEVCRRCGGRLRVIASLEEQAVIERILEHLGRDGESVDPAHPSREQSGVLSRLLAASQAIFQRDASVPISPHRGPS
jgi:hypothetical protein